MTTHYDPPQYPAGEDERSAFPAVYGRTGPWRTISDAINSPAAGADFTKALPANRECKLLLVTAQLVTSAVAANRFPSLQITHENGLDIASLGVSVAQAASQTVVYTWGIGLTMNTVANNAINSVLPEMELEPGCKLSSVTQAKDVGDQWSAIVMTYRLR